MVLVASRVIKLCICAFVYVRKIGPLSLGFDYQFWRVLARSAFPFGLNLAFGLIYTKIDITMLSLLSRDEAEIGFYRAALALVMYLPLLALALTTSLFPIMSELYVTRRETFVSNYQSAIQSLFSLGLPMTIGICLLADRFVLLLYGAEFGPAAIALRILSLAVLLKFIHGALAMMLTASDRQSIRTGVIAFAALGNVILNLFLIPWRGYVGASIAAVLTDGLILVVFYVTITRQLGHLSLVTTVARTLLSGLLMGLYVFVFRQLPLLILVPSAAIIYAVVLYALGGLPTEDFTKFRKMLVAGRFK
jgi:O-antigen/teichoic acid export membrane protein